MSQQTYIQRWKAAGEYVKAHENFPPTYKTGNLGRFVQIVPDPITKNAIRNAAKRIDRAEMRMNGNRKK